MLGVKKISLVFCTIFLSFFSFQIVSSAEQVYIDGGIFENDKLFAGETPDGTCGTSTCNSIFGDPTDVDCPAYWIQWALNLIRYIAIIALFGLSIVDFIKALISNDNDGLKKAGVNTAKRFIYCVLIFFLPIIVNLVSEMF